MADGHNCMECTFWHWQGARLIFHWAVPLEVLPFTMLPSTVKTSTRTNRLSARSERVWLVLVRSSLRIRAVFPMPFLNLGLVSRSALVGVGLVWETVALEVHEADPGVSVR